MEERRGPLPREAGGAAGRPGSFGPWIPSLLLILLVVLFCSLTHWGRTWPTFARKTWIVWSSGRTLTPDQRRAQLYDETYSVLLFIRENTPPDAVILMPPPGTIAPRPGEIPLLASPTSAYTFLYPRVPVHWGDASPWRDRINTLLVYHHWGMDLVDPGAPRTEENDITLYPWPAGKQVSW